MQIKIQELASKLMNFWSAGMSVIRLVGDESFAYQGELQNACKMIKETRNQNVIAIMHDKCTGFYGSIPSVRPPADKSNLSALALIMMMSNQFEISQSIPHLKDAKVPKLKQGSGSTFLPFDPQDDIIFMLKDWEGEILNNPILTQSFRNIIQGNLCSKFVYHDPESNTSTRGRRMLILVTPTDRWPEGLPEVKPIHISLPDEKILSTAVNAVLDASFETYKDSKGKRGLPEFDSDEKHRIINKLHGSTHQFAEDAVSLMVANQTEKNLPKFLNTLEEQMSTYLSGIPGLSYIPKDQLTPVSELPGYEPAVNFVRECVSISDEVCRIRKIAKLKGISLAGGPGCGKTRFGMAVAAEADRPLLLWSPGESQGELVGQSEANTRRVIQIARALRAVILIDDIDKAGISVATGSSTSSIEGGPFGRMINMLLTEMSDPTSETIFVFTMNRINNVPPELIRPGRMDERFFVRRPDAFTRVAQIIVHCEKRGYRVSNDEKQMSMIRQIAADDFTHGWTPAELEDLVKKGVRRSAHQKTDTLDWSWMTDRAKATVPMIKQAAYSADIESMEKFCETWESCGIIESEAATSERKPKSNRAARQVD